MGTEGYDNNADYVSLTLVVVICLWMLLTQSGHGQVRIAAVQLVSEPHFVHRKSLL